MPVFDTFSLHYIHFAHIVSEGLSLSTYKGFSLIQSTKSKFYYETIKILSRLKTNNFDLLSEIAN